MEQDLAALAELRTAAGSAADQEVFAPQIELGIRIDHVLQDWLREHIAAAAAEGPGGPDSPQGSER